MIAVLILARVSLCWNYHSRGTKWSLGVNNIAFYFINFICFAPHLHLTTYISSFLPSFPFKALVFCCGSKLYMMECTFLPGNSEQHQNTIWAMNRLLDISERFVLLCGKLNSGSERYWIMELKDDFFFFLVGENISGLVFLKITSEQKYLLRRTRKFLILG